MAKITQVRRLNYNGEDLGMGFNSDTGLAVGTALDFVVNPGDVSQEAQADVSIITSHEELMDALHMAAELEGFYSFASGGAKVDFSKKTQYNSSSTFVVARMVITDTVQRGKNFKLKPDLQHFFDAGQSDVFDRAFGDSFVRAHYNGGEFYAVMRLTSDDSKTESKLATSLHAEFTTGGAGAGFKGDLETAIADEKTHSEFSVQFYQKGGLGKEEIGSTLDVDEIKKRLKDFPDAVKNHPFPYFIEVATYDTVPLPLGSKEQQDDFLLALADADAKKLKFLQARNDCEFASEHPEYFADPPSKAVLLAAAGAYLQLVNGAISHAVRLAKGQIVPPQLFDPSKLVPPVAEPAIELRKRDVGLEHSFADFWVTKDDPATRPNDRQLVTDIGQRAINELNAFFDIRDPDGDPKKTARMQGEALSRIVASFQSFERTAGFKSQRDLSSLESLPMMLPRTVKSLNFSQNAIGTTKGLEAFTALVKLDLSHNKIAAIDELGALTALRNLQLADNLISDLGPLKSCASLETLDISGNDIGDLTPLGSCKTLKSLSLSGTMSFRDGAVRPSGNPIVEALALGEVPGLVNPFTIGNSLAVRFGVLRDGPDAQFTGTATRIGNSLSFRVRLTRGAQTLEDVWALRNIAAIQASDNDAFALFAPGAHASDFPLTGIMINIARASVGQFDLNLSYVDLADRTKAGVDPAGFPVFATKFPVPTFDATVTS